MMNNRVDESLIQLFKKHRRIVLTGYMGAGKSTVGRFLAKHLNYQMLDTDVLISNQAGQTVSQFFEERGEAFFRAIEQKLFLSLLLQDRLVISTGGGTLVQPGAMNQAKEQALVIYLAAPVDVLFRRVSLSKTERPLLKAKDAQSAFKSRFREREAIYQQAHITLLTDHQRPENIAGEIMDLLQL
jgi:shikimate kinase